MVLSLSEKKSGTIDIDIDGVPSTIYYCPIERVNWSVAIVVAKQSVWGVLLRMSGILLLVAVIGILLIWFAIRKVKG